MLKPEHLTVKTNLREHSFIFGMRASNFKKAVLLSARVLE
jgi:hypothetical protein